MLLYSNFQSATFLSLLLFSVCYFNQNQTNTGSWLYSEPQPASAVAYIKQGRVYNISNINNNLPVGLLVPAISLQVYYNIITFISIAPTHWFVVVSSLLTPTVHLFSVLYWPAGYTDVTFLFTDNIKPCQEVL